MLRLYVCTWNHYHIITIYVHLIALSSSWLILALPENWVQKRPSFPSMALKSTSIQECMSVHWWTLMGGMPSLLRWTSGVWGPPSSMQPLDVFLSSLSKKEKTGASCECLYYVFRICCLNYPLPIDGLLNGYETLYQLWWHSLIDDDFLYQLLWWWPLPIMMIWVCIVYVRYKIISEKKTGVISGWQLELNGSIIYSQNLPKDTRLSQ